jgi:hypothetical protein
MINPKIVFSIPAHECFECLEKQIENFILKVPNSFFVVFLSKNNDFQLNRKNLSSKYENRVFFNPESRPTFWGDCYYQHYSNYNFIKKILDFDYWCFESSNSILLKDGLSEYLMKYDALALSDRNSCPTPNQTNFRTVLKGSWYTQLYKDVRFMELIKNNNFEIYNGFIEGMAFNKNIASEVFDTLDFYKCNDYRNKSNNSYAREELYFTTVFFNKFQDSKYNHNYCSVYPNKEIVKFDYIESLEFILKSFEGFYSVKPCPRDVNSTVHIKQYEIANVGFEKYFYKNKKYQIDQEKFFFTDNFLIGKTFEYINKKGKLGSIRFLPNGEIDLFDHKNEKKWKIDEYGDLHFLDNDGVITTIFYAKKGNIFYGDFWHRGRQPAKGYQWHMLKI